MNLLDALLALREAAIVNLTTKHGQSALKIVNRKIQSLQRKKAWREAISGSYPAHATNKNHPLNLDPNPKTFTPPKP